MQFILLFTQQFEERNTTFLSYLNLLRFLKTFSGRKHEPPSSSSGEALLTEPHTRRESDAHQPTTLTLKASAEEGATQDHPHPSAVQVKGWD